MRVISGSAKGRRLTPPGDRRVRPTSDRIKESLFSILHSVHGDLHGLVVLDLFAGTGSLGIEALSRGADSAVFVDCHRDSAALVRENLRTTGLMTRSEVMQCDVFQALTRLTRKFDLVFADPPYGQGMAEMLIGKFAETSILADGAILIVETGGKETPILPVQQLRQIDRRIYGDTALTFYEFND